MRALGLLLLALVACTAADYIEVFPEEIEAGYEDVGLVFEEQQQQEPETVFRMNADVDGGVRVTGLLQSFRLDGSDAEAINQLLDRPRSSYLDLSWSSWVDQRMEMFDMIQNLIGPVPRCPHMRPERGALDNGMVTYLASSRFGPAILTTYAQKFADDEEDDFDYEEVYIPEGKAMSKSYEDASLLEDLSADADKAFQLQERDSRVLGQQTGLGFFGANIKTPQEKVMYAGDLDGNAESVQPSIRQDPPLRLSDMIFVDDDLYEEQQAGPQGFVEDPVSADMHHIAGFALFLLLCLGCVYVWASLLWSCGKMGREMRAKRRAEQAMTRKQAQDELVIPLLPEGAISDSLSEGVQFAASHAPSGTYFASRGAEYVTIAVPLVNGEARL